MENTEQVEMQLEYLGRTKLDMWDCDQWNATLTYEGREIETKFHTGLGFTTEPTVDDVLHSLFIDGRASEYDNFEDWASDFGYDTDSRRAEQTYNSCLENGIKVRTLLGNSVEHFEEKYEDY